MAEVTVALPVYRGAGTLARAFRCIAEQTLRDIEILVVLNASDAATVDVAENLAAGEPRARVMRLATANLSAAVNAALREARSALVARMDADDACPKDRLEKQAAVMRGNSRLAVIGCAYELVDDDGRRLLTMRPPTDPGTMRWRLLLGNVLAHGSVMMRREVVLRAGGYDESLARAQDYELWLRLSRAHEIGSLPDVLYEHRVRDGEDPTSSSAEQAAVAARAMLGAWRTLAERGGREGEGAVARAVSHIGTVEEATAALEREMASAGPSREGLLAWLYARWAMPTASRRALLVARRARLREVTAEIGRAGHDGVWLYGAGSHTESLLEHPEDFRVAVRGVVDDHGAGRDIGAWRVAGPGVVPAGGAVLLSSDASEDALWAASLALRARGVRVFRMYGD